MEKKDTGATVSIADLCTLVLLRQTADLSKLGVKGFQSSSGQTVAETK